MIHTKVRFPEIKEELFVNFLGYRGSNMIQVTRCEGVCGDNQECAAVKVEVRAIAIVREKILSERRFLALSFMYFIVTLVMYLGPSKASQVNDQVISNWWSRASPRTSQGSTVE